VPDLEGKIKTRSDPHYGEFILVFRPYRIGKCIKNVLAGLIKLRKDKFEKKETIKNG